MVFRSRRRLRAMRIFPSEDLSSEISSKDGDQAERDHVEKNFIPTESELLGEVEVNGATYRIYRSAGNQREVVGSDGQSIGRVRGSPSLLWLLEALSVEEELLRTIVDSAIEEGLLEDLPSD